MCGNFILPEIGKPCLLFYDLFNLRNLLYFIKKRFQKEQAAKAAKVYSGQLRREVNAEREKLGKRPIEDENDNEKDPPQGGGNSGASDLFRI